MHLLWLISIIGISLLHLQISQCNNDQELLVVVGGGGGGVAGNRNEHIVGNSNADAIRNDLIGINKINNNNNNSLIGSILSGGTTTSKVKTSDIHFGEAAMESALNVETKLTGRGSSTKIGDGILTAATVPGLSNGQDGIAIGSYRGLKHTKAHNHQYGHPLAGLANLGIIIPTNKDESVGDYVRTLGHGGRKIHSKLDSDMNPIDTTNVSGSSGPQSTYMEHFISEHTIMAVFTSQGQIGGPCQYMPATRRQNHQCRKEFGLPNAIFDARRLATSHCESQFRYDRWNCSTEIRGKRNIFKKLYKETAFVHALTAAALTHTIARACAEGRMTKCICGPRKQNRIGQDFQWGGCNDNLKHGKRVARSFLNLRNDNEDEVSEILRHDSEVGIEAVSILMKDKCKCHGVSGSCSMKTCWKKLSEFNGTSTLLRQKYDEAIRKAPNSRNIRREAPINRLRKLKQKRKKQSQYTTLYYLETSPTYCSVTKDRQCLHQDNCANLCCGRGYTTLVFKQVEKCRCRFNNGRCCQLICDYCQRFEDKFFCK